MKPTILKCVPVATVCLGSYAFADEPQRRSEVAQRSSEVMPFSLRATMHIFSKTSDGGTQRVVAKNRSDNTQVSLIREHLRSIEEQFRNGDFSAPSQVHGDEMPGLAQLKAAKPGQISIAYKDVDAGGQLTFRTHDTALVALRFTSGLMPSLRTMARMRWKDTSTDVKTCRCNRREENIGICRCFSVRRPVAVLQAEFNRLQQFFE